MVINCLELKGLIMVQTIKTFKKIFVYVCMFGRVMQKLRIHGILFEHIFFFFI